jgi:hypothetical protein
VTAWTIANDPEPIAPHIDHAAVAGILKKAELDQMLAAIGLETLDTGRCSMPKVIHEKLPGQIRHGRRNPVSAQMDSSDLGQTP